MGQPAAPKRLAQNLRTKNNQNPGCVALWETKILKCVWGGSPHPHPRARFLGVPPLFCPPGGGFLCGNGDVGADLGHLWATWALPNWATMSQVTFYGTT